MTMMRQKTNAKHGRRRRQQERHRQRRQPRTIEKNGADDQVDDDAEKARPRATAPPQCML